MPRLLFQEQRIRDWRILEQPHVGGYLIQLTSIYNYLFDLYKCSIHRNMKWKISLLNYFLIGASLIIFYTLLLSFSEHMFFGIAYMIASLMTIILIVGYMCKMLHSKKIGIVIGAILSSFYISCYILLSLSTYALLLGSLILFIALAAMMYGSLQIKC